jgi:hypothetical protein
MKTIKINYMVSREVREPHKKTRIETKTGSLEYTLNWKRDTDHLPLREKIRELNPGWMLAGYCQAPKQKKKYRVPAYWSGSQRCSGPHNCGSTSGPDGTFVTPFRMFGSKILKADIYVTKVQDYDEGSDLMDERGYGVPHYRRRSTPLDLFSKLASERNQCRFDALYRYITHRVRKGLPVGMDILLEAKDLAKRVSIFHPCTKWFLRRWFGHSHVDDKKRLVFAPLHPMTLQLKAEHEPAPRSLTRRA